MDSIFFNNLLEKYKNCKNSSYLKYNFLIEFHTIFKGNFKLEITTKDKKSTNIKYPIKEYKQLKKPYFLKSNIFYFLINDDFTSDIELLLIKKLDNESSIFNNIIIDMDNYDIVCNCYKTRLISKMSNLKKYNDDEILYEYDIYKLYDGINISLYYYNKQWNIAGFDQINITNISYGSENMSLYDKLNEILFKYIMLNKIKINISKIVKNYKELLENDNFKNYIENYETKIRGEEYTEFFNKTDIIKCFYNNLDKKFTYNFVLINKNYNLCSKKNKLKFMNKVNNTDSKIIYNEDLFEEIYVKKKNNKNQKNGLIFISKNNNEDRIIYFNNYYNLNKLLYSHIKKNIFDINMIILKNIILYRINKDLFEEIFGKYIYVYNNINNKINNLIDFLYDYILKLNIKQYDYNDTNYEINDTYNQNFINIIINYIKKNKDILNIFFLDDNSSTKTVISFKDNYYFNKDLYKKLLKDKILNIEIVNDLYLFIFN